MMMAAVWRGRLDRQLWLQVLFTTTKTTTTTITITSIKAYERTWLNQINSVKYSRLIKHK